jgi:hypothetical protein
MCPQFDANQGVGRHHFWMVVMAFSQFTDSDQHGNGRFELVKPPLFEDV